jgi:hypothetical protein
LWYRVYIGLHVENIFLIIKTLFMKIINSGILLIFSVLFLSTGCKKDSKTEAYKCTTCKTTPDALVANDVSSKGVYKGIVIGSTGTISFNLMNGGTTITATLVLDGTTINLTSSVLWVSGVAYVAPFTGTLNGSAVTINFKVDANGGNPIVTASNIPGHTSAQFNLLKESSTALIQCFEGTYQSSKPESGTINIITAKDLAKFGGSSRKSGGTSNGDLKGTITTDGKLMQDGTDYIGTMSGDIISGSFKDSNGNTITVNGKRTL